MHAGGAMHGDAVRQVGRVEQRGVTLWRKESGTEARRGLRLMDFKEG